MKIVLSLLVLLSAQAHSAVVLSARLDPFRENILVEVMYSGGCKEHNFSLDIEPYCALSYPVQCGASLVDTVEGGIDECELSITETAVFNLEEYGLTKPFYNGAALTIRGERTFTGEETSATVDLPWTNRL